ncbi:unnamed protein product [Protopolystoma xenopodis]|uniref:Uncharacterized protein n=1 Tax=Protopolystoma xenopodis TaxID=117903 RepID=A0A448WUU2_9PLAT|nr:unnamed protein product [Protopolystoma xenopodis]
MLNPPPSPNTETSYSLTDNLLRASSPLSWTPHNSSNRYVDESNSAVRVAEESTGRIDQDWPAELGNICTEKLGKSGNGDDLCQGFGSGAGWKRVGSKDLGVQTSTRPQPISYSSSKSGVELPLPPSIATSHKSQSPVMPSITSPASAYSAKLPAGRSCGDSDIPNTADFEKRTK